ncbi:hypothetical protein E2C01_001894 [Portunus trituberculatus]|uniref:Uncharacterized protein n=1 Tax=Portunus trituberculatus TaxID=210409 RepID=A0A5B7CJF2_PORTR|nr:hypothetical protein [Portunus trituberculatus]
MRRNDFGLASSVANCSHLKLENCRKSSRSDLHSGFPAAASVSQTAAAFRSQLHNRGCKQLRIASYNKGTGVFPTGSVE